MKIDDKYRWITEKWTWRLNRTGYYYYRGRIRGNMRSRVLHRCVWAMEHKIPYSEVPMLDHINRDRTDNRLENLRVTTPLLNANNKKDAGSKPFLKSGKWVSRIHHRGKSIHLGVFPKKSRARLVSRVIKEFLMTLEEAIL